MSGDPISDEIVPDGLMQCATRPLTPDELDELWTIMVAIGKCWRNSDSDSVPFKPMWLEFMSAKTMRDPSYAAEYESAIMVLRELHVEHPGTAFDWLFFTYKPVNADPKTRLEHLKFFVVDEFIRMQLVAGGYASFGFATYSGSMAGTRYLRIPPYRTHPKVTS